MDVPVIVVVGAGPGVGGHVAERFARDGYAVALVSRDDGQLQDLAAELAQHGTPVVWDALDVTDGAALGAAVASYGRRFGRIDVLHFNPSTYRAADPLTLTPAQLADDVALGVGALLTALQAARPFMTDGARVTVTGSMAADQPSPAAASLGVQKAGVRNLVRSIDQALAPDGIRAVSVTVRGTLSTEGRFTPAKVAEAIHAAAHQPVDTWLTEVPFTG
ncbi:SDR family oxidoreductase [Nocardioides sp.]|uniref:SDR family oxidoreductase n=1 Tax=Nocardioides sp. TaxID=35761 RepID=UPI0035288813